MARTIKVEHELVEFAGVGHLTHYEIPDLIAESIGKFVNHHEPR
jgi:pimeloyl-ACP methyl ester carboxylesterase